MTDLKSICINGHTHVSYTHETYTENEALLKSSSYYKWLDKRRSVREFSSKPVSKELIKKFNIVCFYCSIWCS